MRNKKGFTLIELLAVIVILAIIAVVTIPMIMNVIEKAKKGALEDSAYGLIESANLYYSENVKEITSPVTFDYANGEQISESKLKYKGKIENGKLILNTDGKVVLCIDNGKNYAYKELSENKVTTGNGTCSYDGETGTFEILSDVEVLNNQIREMQQNYENQKKELEEELEELTNTSHCASYTGNEVTFKVGDYVSMTPTSTSYTTDTSMTGYTSSQTINPSELNLWRIIRINSDGTVDMVSEYVSSVNVYFEGQTGYQNFVGYLNTIAHQYENSCYTVESRHMGYSTQTPYITDTSALTSTTAPQSSETSNSNVTSTSEVKGLGDMGYQTDYDLVNTAIGTLAAYQAGTTSEESYWLASRHYTYSNSTYWTFYGRDIITSGSLYVSLYRYNYGNFNASSKSKPVRPIVTLKSGVKVASGDGTSASPYVLP